MSETFLPLPEPPYERCASCQSAYTNPTYTQHVGVCIDMRDSFLIERMMAWSPPFWWNTNDSPKTLPEYDQIKAAYERAKTCTICLDNVWTAPCAQTKIPQLFTSAEELCAGCIILSGILKVWLAHFGSGALRAWDTVYWQRTPTRWTFSVEDQEWEIYVPQDMFQDGTLAKDGLILSPQPQLWRVPYLPRKLEVSPNTGSGHAVERALGWLRDCVVNHEACRCTKSKLPSRVIEIKGPENVKLHESEGEVEPYVCLSHCWGKGSMIKTTTSSMDTYKQGIPWHELPLTFQEAISFTFRLGYRYLWIDSLCIQQDSIEDWRIEGSRMAHIYSGADLTLAAAATDSSASGCFRQIPERHSFTFSYPDSNGSRLEVHVRPQFESQAWSENRLPLLQRGWTLQECLLSRRLIYFTDEELIWGCRTSTKCECSYVDGCYHDVNMRSPQRFTETFHSGASEDPFQWYRIINAYNTLDLTYEKDIFPALQGMTRQMYHYKKSPYIAGLWESSIISDLLWIVEFPKEVRRPRHWRAPSWSWASLVGGLTWTSLTKFVALCEYINAHVEPAGEDEFGEILSAKITLRGRCLQQQFEGSYQSSTKSYHRIEYPGHCVWEGCGLYVWEDCWPESANSTRPHSTLMAPGERVKTLLVAQTEYYRFLVLRLLDPKKNIYERIGVMSFWREKGSAIYDLLMGEEETIHIV